ncbi:MAG: DUF2804 domain-containing protein [Actinomycetota bacterium]|nr:DUF2804 domain-containing protein [Actinomycetota bacterium]
MPQLPIRGPGVRELDLVLPPESMPRWRAGRPLKRWRYVGVYTPELMLCVGEAWIGPVPQRWWAVALPGGELRERTTFGAGGVALDGSAVRVEAPGVRIELALEESPGVEVVSPVNERGAYIWTRKQACVPVRGTVELDGARHAIEGDAGFVDDSAGYHPRHTTWKWSAGIGTAVDGRPLGWNLVTGLHDAVAASERTLWVAGESIEAGPARFADDLSSIEIDGGGELRFDELSRREHSTNALVMRSRYSQPFGSFSGTLPGGIQLADGFGVMEDHDVRW